MTIQCKVTGELAQHITCQLDDGQSIYADATKFRWKTTNVTLETRLSTPGGKADEANQQAKQGGGFLKAAMATAVEVGKRALSGQSLAFQWFTPAGGSGLVSLAGDQPGQVRVLELSGGTGWRAESRAFILSINAITLPAFSLDSTEETLAGGIVASHLALFFVFKLTMQRGLQDHRTITAQGDQVEARAPKGRGHDGRRVERADAFDVELHRVRERDQRATVHLDLPAVVGRVQVEQGAAAAEY